MTSDAFVSPSSINRRESAAPVVIHDRTLPVLIGLVSGAIQFAYLVQGGFFLDDFGFIARNRSPLSLHLLITPLGTNHFQPATQFMVWIAAGPFHTNYQATVLLLAVLTALGSYWMIRLLDVSFGPRTMHLVIGFLFGTSWVLLNVSQWFAASAATASVVFTVGALFSFSLWMTENRPRYYLGALLCATTAVLFWEIALAIPALLALMWLCFLGSYQSTRRVVLGLLPFAAISFIYLAYVESQPWHTSLSIPTLHSWIELLKVMVGYGLLPTVIGTGLTGDALSVWGWVSVLVVPIGFVGAGVWLAKRGRFRPSAVVFFLVGTVLVSIPIATARDAFDPHAGTTARYITFLPMLLGISVAGAVRNRHAAIHTRRPSVVGWAGAVILAALYLVNLNATFHALPTSKNLGDAASAVSERIGSSLRSDQVSDPHSWTGPHLGRFGMSNSLG